MRILQLCNKSPWPPKEGGSIAMKAITDSLLHEGHQVKILAMSTHKNPVTAHAIPHTFRENTGFTTAKVNLKIRPAKAFYHLFTQHSYIVERFYSKDFQQKLKHILQRESFHIIHLESLFLTPYIPVIRALSRAPVVLRSHNIEHEIWERYAANCKNPLKKWYVKALSRELKDYEIRHINDYDGILPITTTDEAFYTRYNARGSTMALPFALDVEALLSHPEQTPEPVQRDMHSLFHLGSMDWLPNQEAIGWFLKKVWPQAHKQFPQLNLYLAGRNMPDWIIRHNVPGLTVDGEVANAHQYMQSKNIMVVPLFSGSGLRIKILEGMLNKNVIITTTTGARGIDHTPGEHLLIANHAGEFLEQIAFCVNNPEKAQSIAENGARLVREKYSLRESSKKLTAFYKKLRTNQ